MLGPMRDAAALKVGVSYIPVLTLVSTILALASSVPVGWLFEAPNPDRKGRSWRDRIGLTRGETQGTSLALFLRCFAVCLFGYAFSFKLMDLWSLSDTSGNGKKWNDDTDTDTEEILNLKLGEGESIMAFVVKIASFVMGKFGKAFYVMFFLVVHLMKLHSISLMWGVTSEAMEYEEQAELRAKRNLNEKANANANIKRGSIKEEEEVGEKPAVGGKSRARLKRLAFVGFGGTLGGIIGSVFVSMAARQLHMSGLLIVAAILLLLSAELSIEMGQIMLRHWKEEQIELWSSQDDLMELVTSPSSPVTDIGSESDVHSPSAWEGMNMNMNTNTNQGIGTQNGNGNGNGMNSSMTRVASMTRVTSIGGGMKRVASGVSITSISSTSEVDSSLRRVTSIGGGMKRCASGMSISSTSEQVDSSLRRITSNNSMKRCASSSSMNNIRRGMSSGNNLSSLGNTEPPKQIGSAATDTITTENTMQDVHVESEDDNTFKKRLLRGVLTIFRSRLLMTIFTYNALYATTTVLLSFQRAELVSNRSSHNSVDSNTAFLANINIASSVAVFILQASGLGAFIANSLGLRGTLSLMPMVRLLGVAILGVWHVKVREPPNLVLFLVLDEFTKVINFAVAKPVRENLWRGLSNEARYEAKPIVDTLANRWGGGSAAVLISLLDRIMVYSGFGEKLEDGSKSLFGFPPLLILCSVSAVWWAVVSADLGHIRHNIDVELKKNE